MFVVTSNKSIQLLLLNFIGHVRLEELARKREEIKMLLADLSPGFRVLGDFSHLEAMDADCLPEIGRNMELFDQSGVGLVVRVMPDTSKDLGLNILTLFHYRQHPLVVTCETLLEAAKALSL